AAVDRQHCPRDIARDRRSEERGETGEFFGLPIAANRNFLGGLLRAKFRGILAADLLAHNPPWLDAVDRNAVLADRARQALGPCVQCSLGWGGSNQSFGLRLAGYVDHAAPAPLDHAGQQRVRELTRA